MSHRGVSRIDTLTKKTPLAWASGLKSSLKFFQFFPLLLNIPFVESVQQGKNAGVSDLPSLCTCIQTKHLIILLQIQAIALICSHPGLKIRENYAKGLFNT